MRGNGTARRRLALPILPANGKGSHSNLKLVSFSASWIDRLRPGLGFGLLKAPRMEMRIGSVNAQVAKKV